VHFNKYFCVGTNQSTSVSQSLFVSGNKTHIAIGLVLVIYQLVLV